jgi:phenylalanyl-tRNA synthetase alpha chain
MVSTSPLDSLHPLEVKVLVAFGKMGEALSDTQLGQATHLEPSQVSMAVGWLLTKNLLTLESEKITPTVSLTEIGTQYHQSASPPEWILQSIQEACERGERSTVRDLQAQNRFQPNELSRAIGILKKEGSIQLGAGGYLETTETPSQSSKELRSLLEKVKGGPQPIQAFASSLQSLIRQYSVKRGNTHEPFRIEEQIERIYVLTHEGNSLGTLAPDLPFDEVSQLTPDMLKDGSWRTHTFRKYTISLRPPRLTVGRRHPYREYLDSVKRKLMSMGFQEMRGELVETEFWNMDALFMPQFHPARAIHDVYFIKDPSHAQSVPEPFLSQVANAHENGGSTNSKGWGYAYDRDRARRLILRSQGTAVSARMLASGPKVPGKYFSIARCFRYDHVDSTHATDFFQVEGIVLGQDIHFRTLLGLLNLFASEMAQAKDIRFLPAYFPFTEPSVELHVRHPQLGWMELGGAGLFRPEVTLPLGVNVPVIAWGLGLDRMAMVALGIHDIRDLFSTDLEAVRNLRGRYDVVA